MAGLIQFHLHRWNRLLTKILQIIITQEEMVNEIITFYQTCTYILVVLVIYNRKWALSLMQS